MARYGCRLLKPGSIMSGSRSTSGARCVPTVTPRPRNHAGRWNCPRRPLRRSARTTYGRRGSGLAAGKRWRDHGLVFASQAGTPLDASHVRRAFKAITKKTCLGENWTPRELRHSFVSLMSDNGVPIETIADLVGHASTAVTEEVYRHQLKPVITRGAETMNTIFTQNEANSA
ncbi:MAG: tyrosine-type recombinase/integrase [Pseudonocardiaceae bacterium]